MNFWPYIYPYQVSELDYPTFPTNLEIKIIWEYEFQIHEQPFKSYSHALQRRT